MSDISLGFEGFSGYLLLANLASVFIIGFIPGFYFVFLFCTKKKMQLVSKLIAATLIGGLVSYLSANLVLVSISSLEKINNSIVWFLSPIIVTLEIIIVLIHFYSSQKKKKKRNKRSAD